MSTPRSPLASTAALLLALAGLAPGCCRSGRASGEPSPHPEHTAQTPTTTALGTSPPTAAPQPAAPPGALPDEARSLPSTCTRRQEGTIGAFAVKIDEYKRLSRPGPNGIHELAEGTVVATRWALAPAMVDTTNVHIAMNVASPTDAAGLPREIALRPGETIEMMGEFIPASRAHASNARGPAGVIHFTHSPCGHVTIAGTDYK